MEISADEQPSEDRSDGEKDSSAGRDGVKRDPTPDEIATACAEIRRGWDAAEYVRRAPHWKPVPWMPSTMDARHADTVPE